MTPLDFLQAVWPPEANGGVYCIAMPTNPKGFKHQLFNTIVEAAKFADRVKGTENVYFCVNTLIQEKVWNLKHHRDKETREWVAGWSTRTQANMKEACALFFDLDVGVSKPDDKFQKYASQSEALTSLRDFCNATALPIPTVVSSGFGLHVYWIFDRPLASADEWKTQAARLKQLADHYKLRYDPARTTDSSSVLRVPGTINRKPGRPEVDVLIRKVGPVTDTDTLIGLISQALEAASIEAVPDIISIAAMPGVESNLKRTAYTDLIPPPATEVFKVCGQMERLRQLNGVMSYGEWRHGIGVLLFTDEAKLACHAFSDGDPGYTFDRTEQEIDNWKSGPTSCAALSAACGPRNDAICKTCPHVARNQGPVTIARLLARAEPPVIKDEIDGIVVERKIPDPPQPYRRGPQTGVTMLMENKEGKQYLEKIYNYDLYPIDRMSNRIAETEQHQWRFHPPHSEPVDFTVDAATLVDEKALRTRLANVGIHASNYNGLRAYMSAYIQELQRLNPPNTQFVHLGWLKDDRRFVMPEVVYEPDGTVTPATLSSAAKIAAMPIRKGGTLQGQIEALRFYNDPYYHPHQFIILSSLASIIYRAMGHHGVIVNIAGDAGGGKSSAVYAAGGIYGEPSDYVVNGTKKGATALWIDEQQQILSAFPICLDELTGMEAEIAKALAMGATQKQGRKRAGSAGGQVAPPDMNKSNIIISNCNIPLHQLLSQDNAAGTAAAVRVFELKVKRATLHSPIEADENLRAIHANYGWIGDKFIRAVVKHRDAVFARVVANNNHFAQLAGMKPDERFWFAVIAAVLTAGEIAVRMGLLSFDLASLRTWLLNVQLPLMRGIVKEEMISADPVTILTDYLSTINGDIFKIGTPAGGTKPYPLSEPRGALMAHFEMDIGKLYVLKEGFRGYCQRRSQYSQQILKDLRDLNILTGWDVKKALGAGSAHATARSVCFEIDMHHPTIQAAAPPAVVQKPVTKLTVVAGGKKP